MSIRILISAALLASAIWGCSKEHTPRPQLQTSQTQSIVVPDEDPGPPPQLALVQQLYSVQETVVSFSE